MNLFNTRIALNKFYGYKSCVSVIGILDKLNKGVVNLFY